MYLWCLSFELDRVGYIREASFEILHKHYREKTSVPMTILHVFTHIAKEKMMSSSDHDISNAVLKSIVMFLEEKHFGTVEGNAKLHPGKNQCHFSDRSFSLENIALMLMESVQEFTQSNTLHQSLTEFRPEYKNFQLVWARDQSVPLCDILSLVELIGCYTDWTSENIVALLLKMLGMPLSVNFAVSVVSLLGQLSSIGVDADGCENEGISNLREKLSAFLQCETILKAGFAVQIATVCSLLKTLQLDFSTVFRLKTAMLPGCGDQSLSASANLVTKWFSLLSDEQRVFTAEFLQLPVVK
ncbi:BnaA04g20370D [Brassica napus]|uniref:BnaA04g20370D protein n=1 Tax=Brassica napus TaxID=3708 RepID=A0A078I226_BRANA|nr:BnaA04g20370D [Brassica napus]